MTTFAQWLDTFFAPLDEGVASAMHSFNAVTHGFFTPLMNAVSFLGNAGICIIIFALVLCIFKRTRRAGVTALVALLVGALITNLALKLTVNRVRPFYRSPYDLWWEYAGSTKVTDASFPSGHTTAAMAFSLALVMAFKAKRKYFILLFPVLMGLSRIYLIVHYTSDVLGGLLVGTIAALLAFFVVKASMKKELIKNFLVPKSRE